MSDDTRTGSQQSVAAAAGFRLYPGKELGRI